MNFIFFIHLKLEKNSIFLYVDINVHHADLPTFSRHTYKKQKSSFNDKHCAKMKLLCKTINPLSQSTNDQFSKSSFF